MAKGSKGVKTEHSGAKRGGSGYYGHHQHAKWVTRKLRRARDKIIIQKELECSDS